MAPDAVGLRICITYTKTQVFVGSANGLPIVSRLPYALPDEAKGQLRREPEWERAMQRVQDELVDAMEDVETFGRLMEGQSTPADHAWPFGPGRPRIPDEMRKLAEAT
jgi:hypothetical protein